jgi:hypothetical protein
MIFQSSAGEVGIGTTAPAATLDVNGVVNAATSFNVEGFPFAFGSYANENSSVGFVGNTTMTGIGNAASGAVALQDNTTGYGNTASGLSALQANTTGEGNAASGVRRGRVQHRGRRQHSRWLQRCSSATRRATTTRRLALLAERRSMTPSGRRSNNTAAAARRRCCEFDCWRNQMTIALRTPSEVNECNRDVAPLEPITYSMAGRITSGLPIIYSASSACTLRYRNLACTSGHRGCQPV